MTRKREPRVVTLANEYLAWCRRWEPRFRRWPGMWEQVEAAAASTIANIGEAFDSETMPQKRRYFGYAKASAGEGTQLLKGAVGTGLIPADAASEALRLLRDIRWDMVRLIRWTLQ